MTQKFANKCLSTLFLLSCHGLAAAQDTAVRGALTSPDTWDPLLRMIGSLLLVLALVAGLAWAAKRMRQGSSFQGGLIQVISGLSLGGREKVVLLRVADEQVLVGISPSGMSALHVLHSKPEPKQFDEFMEQTQTLERRS